ncbi:hypothetical protein ATEIFO6365_0012006200 [Aspergillus terreus]|uniref:Uncharacterized protein n=1 Tax=Aspergillus terreus TaxID=33178 RepID=A0A5M3ZAH1_ASPTE|nr:hypothetical protein ATETN484_0013007200 [Aspergillus terreus]GFF20306.1 hypothetical protein ATEIFO6365_0012006200 [Aspergillus terreus]
MDTQPAKRSRANSAGDSHVRTQEDALTVAGEDKTTPVASAPNIDIRTDIKCLDAETIENILIAAANTYPAINAVVQSAIEKRREKEQSRIIYFDHYSSAIWKEINVRYRHIAEQCGPMANPKTRYNGLSVLRKIGKTICLSSNDVLRHEVQLWFQWDTTLEDCMLKIVSAMSPKERSDITGDDSSDQALWPKLEELEGLAEKHFVFKGFSKVMELLLEGGEVQYVDDVDDEDEDDDDAVPSYDGGFFASK